MRLKIAVIGAGTMGMNHLRVLRDFPCTEVELVGVADPAVPILQKAMQRFQVAGYADYRQMIAHTRPDLVAVVVPTKAHFAVAAFALEQGCHVLVEKPMTSTVDEAMQLLALAQRCQRTIAVGHVERFNPAIIEVKRRLIAGELGRVFHLSARRLGPYPPRIRDVGVTLDLVTHDIDVMRYLLDSEVAAVYAETRRYLHHSREDLMHGVLRFTNQAIGVLDSNWLTPTKVRELCLTGEGGMYQVNYLTQDLFFYANDYAPTNWDALRSFTGVSEGTMTRVQIQKAESLYLEYQDVCAAIRQAKLPTVTGEDGLAALEIALRLANPGNFIDSELLQTPSPSPASIPDAPVYAGSEDVVPWFRSNITEARSYGKLSKKVRTPENGK
jgi:predicted dehydrogenase